MTQHHGHLHGPVDPGAAAPDDAGTGPVLMPDGPVHAPRSARCGLFIAGHNVHPIQSLRSANGDRTRSLARVVAIDDTLVTVEVRGELRTCRTHDAPRVQRWVERHGPRVLVDCRWSLLVLPDGDGALRCVSADWTGTAWRPCRNAVTEATDAASLRLRLVHDGGFLIPCRGAGI